jgi:hypothetical protein
MKLIDNIEYNLDNIFSIEDFRKELDKFEKQGVSHIQLSYQDYGNPIINIFAEEKVEEQKEIPITYGLIKAKVGWSEFAEVCGLNVYAVKEFGHYEDREVFYITESQAKKLGFI